MGRHRKKHGTRPRSQASRGSVPEDEVQTAGTVAEATTLTKKSSLPRERSSKGRIAKPSQHHRPVEPPTVVADAQVQKLTEVPPHALLAVAKFKAGTGSKGETRFPLPLGSSTSVAGTQAASEQAAQRTAHESLPSGLQEVNTKKTDGLGAAPAIVCSAVLVISAFVTFLTISEVIHLPSHEGRSAFCCPSDVQTLALYANASVDPCQSFFDFVCSNIVAQRSRTTRPTASYSTSALPFRLNPSFELDVLMAANGSRSEVSTFLRSFFDSCLNTDTNAQSIINEVGEALVQIAGDHLRDMRPVSAVAYLLLTNIKYGIPSVVLVVFKELDEILFAQNRREGCQTSDNTLEACVNFSVAKLNQMFKKATKPNEVTAYATSAEKVYQKDAVLESYAGANTTELLKRWHVTTALKAISIGLNETTRVDIIGTRGIDALFGMLSTSSGDPAAGYFLASSTCNLIMDLQWDSALSSKKDFCMNLVDLTPNVRNAMYAVEFITPERSQQVTRVVNAIIKTIKSECTLSSIFRAEDVSLLKTFFDSMTLVLPQMSSLSSIAGIHFAQSFVQKLLRGRASEHETRLGLAQRGFPFESVGAPVRDYNYVALQNGDTIVISPVLYSFMRLDPTHTDIFNTPVIAQALAESIWTFVLRDSELLWSRAARAGIEGLVNCFQDRYLMAVKTLGTREDELEVVAASLALSSVGKSFEERDWYKVEPAWPHWSMSHSRFFYMREAFYRCPMYSRPAGKDIVDVPLMYDQAFSRAFQCQGNDRMAKIRGCALTQT
ncbi:hypothetical protein MRX96_039745 [Rhipicephalus microplus]